MRKYRLPSATFTSDVCGYMDAWERLAVPIEKTFGWELVCFNPQITEKDSTDNATMTFSFARYKNGNVLSSRRVTLDVATIRSINDKLGSRDVLLEELSAAKNEIARLRDALAKISLDEYEDTSSASEKGPSGRDKESD